MVLVGHSLGAQAPLRNYGLGLGILGFRAAGLGLWLSCRTNQGE